MSELDQLYSARASQQRITDQARSYLQACEEHLQIINDSIARHEEAQTQDPQVLRCSQPDSGRGGR